MVRETLASKQEIHLILTAALVCVAAGLAQAGPILTLNPAAGAISGTQGATIGWGFTITNSTNFLEVTSSQFCLNPVSTPFCTAPTTGAYTDIISSETSPVIVGPGSTPLTQAFNALTPSGVGSFLISSSAVNGSIDNGEIVLTYDLFSVSPNAPNFNPTADTISTDNFLTAPASVTVGAATTPEPASLPVVAVGLIGLICFVWRAKRAISLRGH